jgi:hypothetical protein
VPAFQHPRREQEALEILREPPLDSGPQDLHRDILAFARHGAMNLGDRGRRHRRADLGEQALRAGAEGSSDFLERLLLRKGWKPVLQQRQLAGEILANEIGSRRKKLPKFDVAGSQPRERLSERCRRVRCPPSHAHAGQAQEQAPRSRKLAAAKPRQERVMCRKRAAGPRQTP